MSQSHEERDNHFVQLVSVCAVSLACGLIAGVAYSAVMHARDAGASADARCIEMPAAEIEAGQ